MKRKDEFYNYLEELYVKKSNEIYRLSLTMAFTFDTDKYSELNKHCNKICAELELIRKIKSKYVMWSNGKPIDKGGEQP